MDDNISRNHSCPCYQMKILILFSGIIMLFALLTACGRQENKKVEEKSEAQEDFEWTGLNSPEWAQEILDAGNNPDKQEECKTLKQVYIGDTSVLCGVYIVEELEYALAGPHLSLYPNGEGEFLYASASSYIVSGGYETENGKLILTDDFSESEPKDSYTFEIAGDKMIFLEDESTEIWDYGPGTVEDGMVFSFNGDLTEWYMKDDLD